MSEKAHPSTQDQQLQQQAAELAVTQEKYVVLQEKLVLDGLIQSTLAREASLNRHLDTYNKRTAKQREVELQHQVDHDPKTGLLTSVGFKRHASELLELKPDTNWLYIRIDVGKFKAVNDMWGHPYGDETLAKIGHSFRSNELVSLSAREGGDELIALVDLDDVRSPRGAVMSYAARDDAVVDRFHKMGDDMRESDPRLQATGFNFAVGTHRMEQGDTLERADQLADIRMYEDKATQQERFGLSR